MLCKKVRQDLYSDINELATRYQSEKEDAVFRVLHEKVSELWNRENFLKKLANRYRKSHDEVYSIAITKMHEVTNRFIKTETSNYYHYLSKVITNAVIDEVREEVNRSEYISHSYEYAMEDDPHLVKFIPHANAEDEAIESFQKTSEQRQLLANLLERADDKSRQAIIAYSQSKSYLEAAKLLGISNHAVKRRIEKVAKLFDVNEFGVITDYFTVPTKKVS